MTFLNPLVLFGLIAAAIPLILHLLNLRKLRVVEFSTLTFLKELQQTKIRRLKLRQLLLLLIRTLLVVLIVLAFARPALRGTIIGSIGTHAHSTVVFILDDSFSMRVSDERGELFKQAKETAQRLIDLLKDGDEAFLIRLSNLPQATTEQATHDFDALRTTIRESQTSSIRRPIEDALRLSAKLLAQSKNANKEVYLISDMQRTVFPENLKQHVEGSSALFDERVKFFIVAVGSKDVGNAAIDSVEVVTKILEKDKPASVFVSVRNFSSVPLHNYVVSIFLNDVRVAQNNIDADPWGSGSLVFTITPKQTGYIRGYAELENDAVEEDNRRYFTLFLPERINVVMVASSPADIHYPLLALNAASTEGDKSQLNVLQTTPQKFPLLDLKNTDVILFSNVSSFASNDVERIKNFVERGGGLTIFPSENTHRGDDYATLLSALNIPAIEGVTETLSPQTGLSFQKLDFDHPLFATVFEKEQKGKRKGDRSIESPIIMKTLKCQSGKRGHSIITLSDGTAFLSEHPFSEGKILLYSVLPNLSWSDFPVKGIFVPLVYRSVIYTSAHHESQANYLTGEEPTIKLRTIARRAEEKEYKILSPDGTEEVIQPSASAATQSGFGASVLFAPKHLTVPGIYGLTSGKTTLSLFAVNTDKLESDGRKITQDELAEFWNRLGVRAHAIHSLHPTEQIQTTVLQSRFGVELWKYCIAFALFLALLEMFVARDSRKSLQHPLS